MSHVALLDNHALQFWKGKGVSSSVCSRPWLSVAPSILLFSLVVCIFLLCTLVTADVIVTT
jgi:hypothetical protein